MLLRAEYRKARLPQLLVTASDVRPVEIQTAPDAPLLYLRQRAASTGKLETTTSTNVLHRKNAIHKGRHPQYRTEAVLDGFQLSNSSTYLYYEHYL